MKLKQINRWHIRNTHHYFFNSSLCFVGGVDTLTNTARIIIETVVCLIIINKCNSYTGNNTLPIQIMVFKVVLFLLTRLDATV